MDFPHQTGPIRVDLCTGADQVTALVKQDAAPWKIDQFFAETHGIVIPALPRNTSVPPPLVTTPEKPAILLQSYASFCVLLCAADETGAAVMEHQPITDPSTLFLLESFRKQVSRVLRESHTVITGMNSPQPEANEETAEAIARHLSDMTHVTTILALQALRDQHNIDRLNGMIFIPRQLARDDINSLLLLPHTKGQETAMTDEIAKLLR